MLLPIDACGQDSCTFAEEGTKAAGIAKWQDASDEVFWAVTCLLSNK
jgi:hypothetical protein